LGSKARHSELGNRWNIGRYRKSLSIPEIEPVYLSNHFPNLTVSSLFLTQNPFFPLLQKVSNPADVSNFDNYPPDQDIPPDEFRLHMGIFLVKLI
jgi:hypothetical protein